MIKNRTFDPETRTLKKHAQSEDVDMEDTVEKKVEGLAESIIAEDAERRAQELVCSVESTFSHDLMRKLRIFSISLPNGQIGISNVKWTKN